MKGKVYYTLALFDGTRWCIEFGDYDRATVKAEYDDCRDHDIKRSYLKIIATPDDEESILAAIAAMNLLEEKQK